MNPAPASPTQADVVVIGCGPVGVMAALRCVQRGLSAIAIDKSTEIFPLPRAIGMDEEIQRLFQNAGLEHRLHEFSSPLRGAEFVDRDGKRLVGIDFPPGHVGPNGHPPMAMFEQPLLEAALREHAATTGVDLLLGHEVAEVDDHGESVTTQVRGPAGEVNRFESRWVIAADGASSPTRRALGIEIEDQGFDEEWLVIDSTELDGSLELPTVAQQICDPDRIITFIPGHGSRRRWELQLNAGETRDEMMDPGRISQLLGRWARPDQLRVDRAAVYRFHALVAERFRSGSVFLAGDSAHQMPPFNGQGMNTGMRDAENLTWKLALVHRGMADDALLDTYDTERRPHAAGQVEHSADVGKLINALAEGHDVSTAAGYGGGRPFPHLEDGLVFDQHEATGHPIPQPTVGGQRLDELLGTAFALVGEPAALKRADDATAAFWDSLGARTLAPSDVGLEDLAQDRVVIVRPDRYVAAVTDDLDETTRLLKATLRRG